MQMGGAAWLDDGLREQYRNVWRQGLEGPLNYYRASPLKPATSPDDPIHTFELPREAVTVNVPTTVLWGEGDVALPPSLLEGLDAFVSPLVVQRVAGASHWIVHEQPTLIAATIERLLRPPRTDP